MIAVALFTNKTVFCISVACVAGVLKWGGGRGGRTREKNGGLAPTDKGTPATKTPRPPSFHFCGRWRPQNSDWLIFDGKSHENDVI